ncbi:C39 family peptidase [Microbulbifer sp. PAAF003]|uniref:C39 family peptidase n=1 Tax=Microbulbifer sp. PAAF003 TaxID=3243375 RepID=UPI00403904AF
MKYIITLILVVSTQAIANSAYINEIPDFTQTDIIQKKYGYGKQLCGPVAASNSLFWLNNQRLDQITLIKRLASKNYMNTSLNNGTGTSGMLRGIDKISNELFGRVKLLEYQGWRKHPAQYSNGAKVPSVQWLKEGVNSNSTVLINVGWYKLDGIDTYKRVGGHWVTLVGYTSGSLIIHDPAPRAGSSFANEYVKVSTIQSGTLTGNKKGLPRPAIGYIQLGQGMHIKSSTDLALIDGAIKLKI